MLHQETVEANTFRLLKNLMQDAELSSFSLAGGTSLALLLGHRMSIDLIYLLLFHLMLRI